MKGFPDYFEPYDFIGFVYTEGFFFTSSIIWNPGVNQIKYENQPA